MDREKNEREIAKEIEREKMKQQLVDMKIYEEAYTFEEMKHLISFLNDSETTPNVAADNKDTLNKETEQHSDNECLSVMTSETDASQEQTLAVQDPPKMYKSSRTSPTVTLQERKNSRHSSSSENSQTIFDVRSPAQGRCKGAENDETIASEKQQHEPQTTGANRSFSSKAGNGKQESQNSPVDSKMIMQCATPSNYHQRLERWRINPLDVCINENDVPLQQPRSRLAARKSAPSSGCHNKTYTSEQHDQKMRALGQHLREVADLWYNWQLPANAKFEWGVPIEVGTANGSLDRNPITEPKTEPIKAECVYRDSYERSSKRKANSLIAHSLASLNNESSSDDEDQYEFTRVKKKKVQPDDKSNNNVTDRTGQQHARASSKQDATTSIARQQQLCDVGDASNAYLDDKNVRLPRRRKTEDEENDRSPVLITQTKRAVPSAPKVRPNLPRMRKGYPKLSLKLQREKKEIERTRNQKDNAITDEEIRRKLEEDSDGEEVATILRKDTDTQSKEAKSRLQERLSSNTETLTEILTYNAEKESNQRRGNKEKKADLERKNENMLYEVENKSVSWERHLLDDDDDDEMEQEPVSQNGNQHAVAHLTDKISCPICNKPFPPDEIENHAADCDQFENDDEDDKEQLICNICDIYKTTDAMEYQRHVKRCINSRKGSDKVDIVSISSSHRNPGGQKAASSSPEIDFMDQTPSHSRTRVFINRKRKH